MNLDAPVPARAARARARRVLPALALALVVGLVGVAIASPASAAGEENGPILTLSWPPSLRNLDGTVVSSLDSALGFEVNRSTVFSPDGGRIAYVRTECATDPCDSYVVVRDHLGDVQEWGPLADSVESLTWSPDGTQLALLTTTADFVLDSTIWRLPLTAANPVPVLSDSTSFEITGHGEISWGPTGSIVFVAGEPEPGGFFNAVHSDQLYTVPATGGMPTRLNVHKPESCSEPVGTVCQYSFDSPEWSPDGSQVVVEVTEDSYDTQGLGTRRFLGTISQGDEDPTFMTGLRNPELGYSSFQGPSFSPDGSTILFQDDDGTTLYSATYGAGVRTRLPASFRMLGDWQPCPSGVCAPWGTTTEKLPSTITLNMASLNGTLRTNGQVTPNKAGQGVTVTLKRQVKGKWRTVTSKSRALSAKSRYVIQFASPKVDLCQLVARYGGDTTHKPAAAKLTFYC